MNIRFIITNRKETEKEIYDYINRGEASESRIKELKNYCFAD